MSAPLGTFHDLGLQRIPELGKRRVRVYVPSVERPADGWRILYMLDGQNVFGDEGSFAGGWFAHEAVEKLARRRAHVPLIVAVDNGQAQRLDELTPWPMDDRGGGKGEHLANWLADALVPRMVKNFGGLSGPIGSVICGSSLGGLFALYAHHRRPDAFGGAIAMSSSLFWARRRIFNFIADEPVPWTSRIYLDCGGREGGGRLSPLTEQMGRLLAYRGYGPDRLKVRTDPRGAHNERAWRKRLPGALRFMYQLEAGARRHPAQGRSRIAVRSAAR